MSKIDPELLSLYHKRVKDRKKYVRNVKFARGEKQLSPIRNLLHDLFKKDNEALAKIEENRALQAWPEIVGEAASLVSFPVRIQKQRLVVKVEDPLWRQQLILLRHKLIKEYWKKFPKLKLRDIFFTV